MSPAPIALFIYDRPDHTRRAIEHLSRCDGFDRTAVFVFADGPRDGMDTAGVAAARGVAHELLDDRARYFEADHNRGLAASLVDGITRVCEAHGRVIVVEDDLLVEPGFLTFLNEGLERYEDDPRVMQIAGYQYPVRAFGPRRRAVVLPFITTWGWATWSRAWRHFDVTATGWQALRTDRALRRRFDLDGVAQFSDMLMWQMEGRSDAWGPRWYWSVFRQEGLAIWPPQSLVRNAGYDGSGAHGWRMGARVLGSGADYPPPVGAVQWPSELRVDPADLEPVLDRLRAVSGGPLGPLVKAYRRLKHRLHKGRRGNR